MAALAGCASWPLKQRSKQLYQAYLENKDVLPQAFQQGRSGTAALCVLAKALPYATLVAAASKALHTSSSAALSSVMRTWDPTACARWGEAAARDQRVRVQDPSLQSLLVEGTPPQEPGRHWCTMQRLPRIHLRTCYMCRQEFVEGHSLGRWGQDAGGHSYLCFHCGLANPREMQAQEAVSLAGMHAVVTGCRHTVGYALTLRLLRCGARVLGTSRFPGAALLNYPKEPDFEAWRGCLELMACDFLQPVQVDALARRIAADPPHIYVSNAFLTVEQSSAYYAAVRSIEQRMVQPTERGALKLPRLLSRLLGWRSGTRRSGGPAALPAPGPDPLSAPAAAGQPGAFVSAPGEAGAAAALVLSAAAPGVVAQAAAAGAWLAEQGLQLNELGTLQEGPRPTLWTARLREATTADLAKSAWVNQVVPARLLQVAQAAMQRAQQGAGSSAGFVLAGGPDVWGGQQRKCFLINVTSTEHLHQRPTHAVTSMSKAAMETLWEKVTLERCPGIAAYSADPGFASGVMDAIRKPLTAADGAARVPHPLLAWASGRLPDDQLAHVLMWKDYLPLRVLPAAQGLLAGLRMHPLTASMPEPPSWAAAAAPSGGPSGAGPSGGRLEVWQVAEGQHKVGMVVGGTLREVGPFLPEEAHMVHNLIAEATTDEVLRAKVARNGGRCAAADRHIHTQFNKIDMCIGALRKRSGLLIGAAITRQPDIARLVLSHQPGAAEVAQAGGWRLAHFAARYSAAEVLRLVQQAAPGLEDCSDALGRYPIHYAVCRKHAATVDLLAPRAPHTALVADEFGHCALAGALYRGRAAVVHAMLAALPLAPGAVLAPSQAEEDLSLAGGFRARQHAVLVRRLLPLVSADCMLMALSRSLASYPPAAGLLVEAVLRHLPLTEQQWALVPPHMPGLGSAVQPMLTQPAAQAQQLAARLEPCDLLRLHRHLGVLCLLRVQRQLGIELPLALTTRILSLLEAADQ